MHKSLRKMSLILLAFFIIGLIGGCTAQRKPVPPSPAPAAPERDEPRGQAAPDTRNTDETRDIAVDITKAAETVPGVSKAYTVVVGNTVLIGFDMDKTKQELGISKVKNDVAEKAEADPRIVRAYVSGDPDITARIKEISYNIQNGKPVTDYLDEIGEIIQRLTPKTD